MRTFTYPNPDVAPWRIFLAPGERSREAHEAQVARRDALRGLVLRHPDPSTRFLLLTIIDTWATEDRGDVSEAEANRWAHVVRAAEMIAAELGTELEPADAAAAG